jgi:GNAT superfamily N-acetyltransferase
MNLETSEYKIRNAKHGEEIFLSELAIRSKAYWGYTNDFLNTCRLHIKIDHEYIEKWPVVLIENNNEILGFYSLKIIKSEPRLDNLWIEPKYIKQGIGRILFEHACETAKYLGWTHFRLAGEPDAVEFYEKMGAKLIGKIQSRISEDLFLPHMEMSFERKQC